MIQSGRFDTSTKTKIKTEHGTILKVVVYEDDCTRPDIEYRIRGICDYCGDKLDCWCFTDEQFKDPLQEATDYLVRGFVCDKPECVIKFEEKNDPEQLKILQANYKDDEYGLQNMLPRRASPKLKKR
jgi:hypothetical protein